MIKVVDPTFGTPDHPATSRARPFRVEREKVHPRNLALLSNAKPNSAELLRIMGEILSARWQSKLAYYSKPNPSVPASEELLDNLEDCDLAIVAAAD